MLTIDGIIKNLKQKHGEGISGIISNDLKTYPVVLPNGHIALGAIAPDGKIYDSMAEAAEDQFERLISEHFPRLEKEFNALVDAAQEKKRSNAEARENAEFDRKVEHLFKGVKQTARTKEEALAFIKFMQMNERNTNVKIKQWSDEKITTAIMKLVDSNY